MPPPLPCVVLLKAPHELISRVIDHQRQLDPGNKSLLIICASRDSFLQQIQQDSILTDNDSSRPTLEALAAARHVTTVFAPSLLHLRAYLATIGRSALPSADTAAAALLAVWGLVEVHKETSEYAAQGIGRTAAAVVDAGLRSGRRVLLGERNHHVEDDEGAPTSSPTQDILGELLVPILNSTVKTDTLGDGIARRMVSVRQVLARWFVFAEDEDGREVLDVGGVDAG